MGIPNATPAQLASQLRIRRRAVRLLAEHGVPTPQLDVLLLQRPELSDLPTAGVVAREAARWSA